MEETRMCDSQVAAGRNNSDYLEVAKKGGGHKGKWRCIIKIYYEYANLKVKVLLQPLKKTMLCATLTNDAMPVLSYADHSRPACCL